MTDIPQNIVRLKDLNAGDWFLWVGQICKIIRRSESGGIEFFSSTKSCRHVLGINSMMKVEQTTREVRSHKKPVSQYTLSGEHVRDFDSITEAALAMGSKHLTIGECCAGFHKTAAGYKWKFKQVFENGENNKLKRA